MSYAACGYQDIVDLLFCSVRTVLSDELRAIGEIFKFVSMTLYRFLFLKFFLKKNVHSLLVSTVIV